MLWIVASTIAAMLMAILMIIIRLKASHQPTSVKKIVLPPMMMATGGLMFIFPQFQLNWIQALEALGIGMIFSILLIKTSAFTIRGRDIYLTPSKSFTFILFGLLIARLLMKMMIGSQLTLGETGGLFFLLAFGMISTWRITMLYQYKQIEKKFKQRRLR